jgi:transcription elongation factor Elf1
MDIIEKLQQKTNVYCPFCQNKLVENTSFNLIDCVQLNCLRCELSFRITDIWEIEYE